MKNHETHRALELLETQHGSSINAEICSILESAMQPKAGLGSALADIGRELSGVELDVRRDSTGTSAAIF